MVHWCHLRFLEIGAKINFSAKNVTIFMILSVYVYTVEPMPPLHQSQYCLHNQDVIGRLNARTEKLKSTFYPNCLSEWNRLEPELRLGPFIAVFKKKLLSIIRPPAKSVYGIHDPRRLSHLTQLKVGLSKLNFHNFKHNFRATIYSMCPTSDGIEDTEHFCCSASLFMFSDKIFSLEWLNYYDHSCKSPIFQMMPW